MKALLRYGNFTDLIELPRELPSISIVEPMDMLAIGEKTFMPTEEYTPDTTLELHYLKFRYKKRLSDNIVLYEFYERSK